jgi:hypothetical protein
MTASSTALCSKHPGAFVVYARVGTFAEDSPTPASRFDHQKSYIDFWLKFIGVKRFEHKLWSPRHGAGRRWGQSNHAWSEGRNKVGGGFLSTDYGHDGLGDRPDDFPTYPSVSYQGRTSSAW